MQETYPGTDNTVRQALEPVAVRSALGWAIYGPTDACAGRMTLGVHQTPRQQKESFCEDIRDEETSDDTPTKEPHPNSRGTHCDEGAREGVLEDVAVTQQSVSEPHNQVALELAVDNFSRVILREEGNDRAIVDRELNELLRQLFVLDDVGTYVGPIPEPADVARAKTILQNTSFKSNGRFTTGLLWKSDEFRCPDSKPMAFKRLLALERKLDKDPELNIEVHNQIRDYIKKGFCSCCHTPTIKISKSRQSVVSSLKRRVSPQETL